MNPRLRTAAIAAAVVVIDRVTKMYIRSAYTSWDVTPVIPGTFNIVHTENPGAAFGILADSPSEWSSMLLVAVSLVVMAIIGVMLWRPRPIGDAVARAGFGGTGAGVRRRIRQCLGPAVRGHGDRFSPGLLRIVRISVL